MCYITSLPVFEIFFDFEKNEKLKKTLQIKN